MFYKTSYHQVNNFCITAKALRRKALAINNIIFFLPLCLSSLKRNLYKSPKTDRRCPRATQGTNHDSVAAHNIKSKSINRCYQWYLKSYLYPIACK